MLNEVKHPYELPLIVVIGIPRFTRNDNRFIFEYELRNPHGGPYLLVREYSLAYEGTGSLGSQRSSGIGGFGTISNGITPAQVGKE